MSKFLVALFSLLALTATRTVYAAESDWNGVFKDPIFSPSGCNENSGTTVAANDCSQMFVCASQSSNGVWYGQARMGNIAYLRGQISGQTWSGNYYFAGMESKMGEFEFQLNSNGDAYTIQKFMDSSVKGSYGAGMSGSKMLADTPNEKDCFKTDLDYIGTSHSWTGSFTNGDTMYVIDDVSTPAFCRQSSYVYSYQSGPQSSSEQGTCYENNQVSPGQYFESGTTQGLELMVAKNADSYYYLWWNIANDGEYDWSTTDPGINNGYNPAPYTRLPPGDKLGYSSDQYVCYEFQSTDMENSCFERAPVGANIGSSMTCPSDQDNQDTYDGLVAVLSLILINFITSIGTVYYLTF